MNDYIAKLQKLRNMAIMAKSPLQFGLTSLLIELEYGTDLEQIESNDKELIF